MRRLLTAIIIALSMLISSESYAQQTVKHIVQKGETLSTIAAKYSVMPKDIIDLNPMAQRYVFVGMELQIPQVASPVSQSVVPVQTKPVATHASGAMPVADSSDSATALKDSDGEVLNESQSSQSAMRTEPHFTLGYDLSLEEKAENTTAWGVSFALTTDQYFTEMLFAGTGVGLSIGGATTKLDSYKYTSTAYTLNFPVYVGISPVNGLDLYTGPSFNWLIGGGTKTFDGTKKISESKFNDDTDLKRFSPTWKFSVRICGFIYLGVNVGLQKDSGVSMTFGLSI